MELTVSEVRRLLSLVSAGAEPTTLALEGSTLVVCMASSPSGRSQALPLQAQRRASGMIYNCSIRLYPKTARLSNMWAQAN